MIKHAYNDGNEDMTADEIEATFRANEIYRDMRSLGYGASACREATDALAAAISVGEYTPPGMLAETARVLGMTENTDGEPLSSTYKRAACALEWGKLGAKWQTFSRLPTAGGWHDYALPKEEKKRHFVWVRINTGGTGNGGRWVPGGCRTQAAKALFSWFRHQTSVPFYGGYWWEAIDEFGPEGMDEIFQSVLRARARGLRYPNGCSDAALIDPRLGRLSGPRMWALVGAVAPYDTWHPDKMAIRRAERRAKNEALRIEFESHGVKFTPAD